MFADIHAIHHVYSTSADLPPPFPYPPAVGLLDCTHQVQESSLEVSCSFDSSVVLGYSVMLQYAGSLNVLTKETKELLSPVIFDGLSGGLFSVTVFPLTDNGLIGTSVAYDVQVMVTAPTTTIGITSSVTTTIPPDVGTGTY